MEKLYDTIVLNKDNYENESDFWAAVAQQIKILTDNHNICVFDYEDCGVYRIEFGATEYQNFGNAQPIWLTVDEKENLWYERKMNEEE